MSYEDAPATKMLAAFCAMCARELLDAQSVEAGVGPVCRAKYGIADTLDEDDRKLANNLIHMIACEQSDTTAVRGALKALDRLGCANIVDRISKRIYGDPIKAWVENGRLVLKAPYDPDFNRLVQRISSRRWDREIRANTFDLVSRCAIEDAIRECFPHARVYIIKDSDGPGLPAEAQSTAPGFLTELCPARSSTPTPRMITIRVVRDDSNEHCAVYTPYNMDLVAAMRGIKGRYWDAAGRVNTFPFESQDDVLIACTDALGPCDITVEEGTVRTRAPKRTRRTRATTPTYSPSTHAAYGRCEDAPACGCC